MIERLKGIFKNNVKSMAIDKPIGLNLTSLSDIKITKEMIEEFIEICFEFFKAHDVEPTYWGVDGKGFSNKLQKFTQRKLKNLKEKKDYLDREGKLIEGIDFVINPKDSDAPAFDEFFNVSFGYSSISKRTRMLLTIDPHYIPIQPNEIKWFIEEFTSLFTPDFGYVYEHEDYWHVSAKIIQYNDGKETPLEEKIFDRWYALPREEKKKTLIEPFIVNILRRELFQETIEKLLKCDKEFLSCYEYQGECFKEVPISNEKLACIVRESYLELCK